LASSSDCDSGIIGPATKPCSTRNRISSVMFGARPHSHEHSTNSSTLPTNSLTWPKRSDSQPVSGTDTAFATAKLVMTQVPWFGLTPRSPAIAGSDTFAIDESSMFMNVAADSAIVPHMRSAPSSGGWSTYRESDAMVNCLERPLECRGPQAGS